MFYHTFPQGEHLWFLAGSLADVDKTFRLLEIYVVFRDDMGKDLALENPLMFRVSCVGDESRISLNQPEGLFLTFQVFLSVSASLFARRSVLGVPCFAAHSLHFEGISYATGD